MPSQKHLHAAKLLIDAGDLNSLRYAALELRMCCEVLTYKKLKAFVKVIPDEELKTWQPPQAVKVLLDYDEYADQSVTVFIGDSGVRDVSKMNPIGTHHSLRVSWLRKNYNKLGALLHYQIDPKKSYPDTGVLKQDLLGILAELEKAASSRVLSFHLSQNYSFTCGICGKEFKVPTQKLKKSRFVQCIFANCGAEYSVKWSDDKPEISLTPDPGKCSKCKGMIWVGSRNLRLGYKLRCRKCDCEYEVTNTAWKLSECL